MSHFDYTAVFALGQLVGATIGAVYAILAELRYLQAIRDGKVTTRERRHILATQRGLRFGMSVVLLSSLGLVLVGYVNQGAGFVLAPSYLAFVGLVVLIVTLSWVMSKRPRTFVWASLLTFTGWWYMVYLTMGALPVTSLAAAVSMYLVVLALLSSILHGARSFAKRRR